MHQFLYIIVCFPILIAKFIDPDSFWDFNQDNNGDWHLFSTAQQAM